MNGIKPVMNFTALGNAAIHSRTIIQGMTYKRLLFHACLKTGSLENLLCHVMNRRQGPSKCFLFANGTLKVFSI